MRLHSIGDHRTDGSIAHRARSSRMALFCRLIAPLPVPLRILDIGGLDGFWQRYAPDEIARHEITMLNLEEYAHGDNRLRWLVGDARCLDMPDGAYDVVFSNSTIEHVGDWSNQQRMAAEVQRVARYLFVQTPNYWFPVEPHFLIVGFQWLPMPLRVWLLSHTSLGRIGKRTVAQAVDDARRIRLLTQKEMRRLFPGASLVPERFGPLVKSWMVHNF